MNKHNSKIELSCSTFATCDNIQGTYTCNVGDSNYLFRRCTSLLLIPKRGTNLPQIDDIIKDLHFEYTVDNKSIVGEPLEVKFTRRTGQHFINDYWYDCLISRPLALALDDINFKPISDIRLVFTSDYIMEAKFNVESTFMDTIKVIPSPSPSGCIIL